MVTPRPGHRATPGFAPGGAIRNIAGERNRWNMAEKQPSLVEFPGEGGPIYLDQASIVAIFPHSSATEAKPMCYVSMNMGGSNATYTVLLSSKNARVKLAVGP